MIKAAVIGATGYVGGELARLLLYHDGVTLTTLMSRSGEGKPYRERFRNFWHTGLTLTETNFDRAAEENDVIFVAAPHGVASANITGDILKKTRVIDMGADFRLSNADIYEKWYNTRHEGRKTLPEAVYGLTELWRGRIAAARLVANPGCYTTAAITALWPLFKERLALPGSVIVDAISGVSGSGRDVRETNLFCEVNESLKAYGVGIHRHTPEIEEGLSRALGADVAVTFTPHLAPVSRGILATCYVSLAEPAGADELWRLYSEYYGAERFIRLLPPGNSPQTRWVRGSNYLDIGVFADERTGRAVIVAALDNMVKGAAGQAVQNMNVMFGLPEDAGIGQLAVYP
ncbi:MAG: N-acetyl-gamma-glutamyl-phosphate reductase [Clostridiales bacterium]|nr:N-acetyl-gamma-glutamyl-phosphate reductase [Clostridiales bacterium]